MSAKNIKALNIKDIASSQSGYFTAQQAGQVGYSFTNLTYIANHEGWLKIDRGLYRLPGFPDTFIAKCYRWYLWSRDQKGEPQAIISHLSALRCHELIDSDPAQIDMIVPPGFRKRLVSGVLIRQTESVAEEEITVVSGLRVIAPARAVVESAADLLRLGHYEQTLARTGFLGASAKWPAAPAATENHSESAMPASDDKADEGAISLGEKAQMADRQAIGAEAGSQAGGRSWFAAARTDNRVETGQRRYRGQAAFTLVELLVVTAIISVLAAMLLPALEKATRQARKIACVSNLKQLGVACEQYFNDYSEYFYADGDSGQWNRGRWWQEKQLYRYFDLAAPIITSDKSKYLPNGQAFLCPAAQTLSTSSQFGYNVMTFAMSKNNRRQMRSPSQVFLWADRDGASNDCEIGYWSFQAGHPEWDNYHARHEGWANLLRMDVHVDSSQQITPLPREWGY